MRTNVRIYIITHFPDRRLHICRKKSIKKQKYFYLLVFYARACYNKVMETRKITGLLCAAALSAGLFAGGASVLCANAETSAATQLTKENTELFLPGSYEQYLSLENPAYVAFNGNYIAVADGNKLYFYDVNGTKRYFGYEHCTGADSTPTNISKIQFSKNGKLFYSDIRNHLYEYDFTANEAVIQDNISCNNFLIEGDYLYTATEATTTTTVTFSYAPLDNIGIDTSKDLGTFEIASKPYMTSQNGKLYCIINNNSRISYDLSTHKDTGETNKALDGNTHQIAGLRSVSAFGDYIYYTVYNDTNNPDYPNGLYRSDFAGKSERLLTGNGYTAVTSYNGKLYCIHGKSIREIEIADGAVRFTGYEISASSDSENRLAETSQSVRAGNLLVTADKGNKRITVYNLVTDTYSVIPCIGENGAFTPNVVATDGETIAVSSERSVYTCKFGEKTFTLGAERSNTVTGLACVYGNCYFVTLNSAYGKLGESGEAVRETYGTPNALTSDVYGNLYVACSDGTVRKYTEEEFSDPRAEGVATGISLPAGFTSFRADFKGNLYCLAGNKIYRNGQIFAEADTAECVYRETPEAPVSLALGFEDKRVFLVYDNFILKTSALDFPALDSIPTEGKESAIFGTQSELNLVTVQPNAVGFRIDLERLKEGSGGVFPYEEYFRSASSPRGILLTETQEYNLVAFFGSDHKYTVNLFQKESCTPVDRASYWQEKNETQYVTSDVSLSLFPCLVPALRSERLSRGTEVNLCGVVSSSDTEGGALLSDYEYAYVSYTTENGKTEYGYLPLSYLTKVKPNAVTEEFRLAYLRPEEEGIEFISENGAKITVTERTQVEVTERDGELIARYTKDGVQYYAVVTEDLLARPVSEALRISLIVILSVAAALIIGGYVYLLPRKKEKI